MTLAEALKAWRLEKGMGLRKLAALSEVPRPWLQEYEKGQRDPCAAVLARIVETLENKRSGKK